MTALAADIGFLGEPESAETVQVPGTAAAIEALSVDGECLQPLVATVMGGLRSLKELGDKGMLAARGRRRPRRALVRGGIGRWAG